MFDIGREYRRKLEIHGVLGGQAQGGISTPRNHPVVLIFTSEAGETHGYRDEFREDGVFWYTGEGQVGDMTMTGGNRAILEHHKTGKLIHLFEYTRKAYVRYIGEAECIGFHEEIRPDREGKDRKVFVFHLDINSVLPEHKVKEIQAVYEVPTLRQLRQKSLDELRTEILTKTPLDAKPELRAALVRNRAAATKQYVITRSSGKCEGCNIPAPFKTRTGPYLECHHLYRVADGGSDDPLNVIALCPNCHRRAHYSVGARDFNQELMAKVIKIEQSLGAR